MKRSLAALDPYLELRGARLRYRVAGRGPVLLLLHGWALDLDMWAPQFAALTHRYRLVAIDRRGFGRSTGSPSIEHEVRDVRVLCQRLGLRNIAVLGMSQGTRVALRLAQSRSLSIRCLVLDGPPAPPRNTRDAAAEDPPLSRYREILAREGLNAFRRAWRQHPLMRLHQPGGLAHRQLQHMIQRYRGADLRRAPAPTAGLRRVVPEQLRKPTLVICGREEVAHRAREAQELARRLPRAELRQVDHAAHLPNLDSPRQYNRILGAFLRRHPGPTPRGP